MKKIRREMLFYHIKIVLLGAALSLLWGGAVHLLHLDRIFPDRSRDLFDIPLTAQTAFYCVLSPVLEECVFRGLLFSLLRKVLPWKTSACMASAAFALWHGNMLQILFAFPMGLLFQYLLKRDRTLLSPICCHAGANLAAVAAAALAPLAGAFP